MAEFDGLDSRLRDAFAKAAEQGDSTGVADAIRSRVAAGDPGTSVAGGTAPGWGGGAFSWLPWLGLIVVGGLVGGALGASGAVGRPAGDVTIDVPVSIGESAPAHSCVDGPVIGRIAGNTRVLAVQRSDDALWVGVRDPGALGGTIWVALGDVSLDEGTPALEELPVGGACPETVVVVPTEEPTPDPTQEPAPGPGPNPGPSDTTAPSVSGGKWSPALLYGEAASPYCDTESTISITVTDNQAVASVGAVANNPSVSVVSAGKNGSTYHFTVTATYNAGPDVVVGVTFTATDSSGNSTQVVRSLTLRSAGNCVI